MTTATHPTVTILHSLPGRLRVAISHLPDNAERFAASIREHEGIAAVTLSPHSRSVLTRYDNAVVKEHEIIIRIALSLSMDRGAVAVSVLGTPDRTPLSTSAVYSGMALAVSVVLSYLQSPMKKRAQIVAAVAAGGAALDHAWQEIRKRGYFDPEVASIGYLVSGMMRGRPLRAAAVTWFATFGRHFFETSRSGVLVEPVRYGTQRDATPDYRVVISADRQSSSALRAVAGLLKNVSEGGTGDLLEQIRNVSASHGQTLHGIDWMPKGIPIEFH